MKKNMREHMQKQLGNITRLNADTTYESKNRNIETRPISLLKELPGNDIIPPLDENDFQNLYTGIKVKGIKTALHISKDNIVLCGNNRLRIARELGITEIPVITVDIPPEEYIFYAIEDNLFRRQLNNAQKADLILMLKPGFLAQAIERRKQNLKQGKEIPEDVKFNTIGKTTEKMAHKVGISPSYLKQYEKVKKENLALAGEVKKGNIAVSKAYNQIKQSRLPSTDKTRPPTPSEILYSQKQNNKKGIIDWKSDIHKKELVIFFEDTETQEFVHAGIRKFLKENKVPFTRGKL